MTSHTPGLGLVERIFGKSSESVNKGLEMVSKARGKKAGRGGWGKARKKEGRGGWGKDKKIREGWVGWMMTSSKK